MPEKATPPTFMTATEVADMFAISTDSLAQDRFRGEGIPYVKIGSRVRYRLDAVLAYVDANTAATVPANRPARSHAAKRV